MTFAQRRNRVTTLFLERISVVKRRMAVLGEEKEYNAPLYDAIFLAALCYFLLIGFTHLSVAPC